MLFNSLSFAIFLPLVFILYWFVFARNLRLQNLLVLLASYYFYACWDWRFLFLLIFSTFLDYYTGLQITRVQEKHKKKFWFWLSILVNLGFLGVFKYYNFFITSFAEFLGHLGITVHTWTLAFVLPVGISFYTFHGLSYVIDIYKEKIEAEEDFVDYAVFVSFFPLLVAGPIERATHLLPQIKRLRVFNYSQAQEGLQLILWGLFKKIVIADQCATYSNLIFNNSSSYSGATLVLGALFFTFQIYGDFSGYSDIALGTARLFGVELLRNFAYPYFSRDIAEFWRRWHISLSSWFRDYLYIPLGGSKGGTATQLRNTFIIFTVSGFWHGANWTFIVWGVLNAIYFLPLLLSQKNRHHINIVAEGKSLPSAKEVLSILLTFSMVVFAWIFFRANSLSHAWTYIVSMFEGLLSKKAYVAAFNLIYWEIGYGVFVWLTIFVSIEWIGRESLCALKPFAQKYPTPIRWLLYYAMIAAIFWFSQEEQQFIYFQF